MQKFQVTVREERSWVVVVEAEDEAEARNVAMATVAISEAEPNTSEMTVDADEDVCEVPE